MVIYVDVLFLINFSMDFLSLFFCSKIFHRKIQRGRMIVSSTLGAIYATFQVLLDISSVFSVFLLVLFAFLMVKVAFNEKSIKLICVQVIMFLFVSATLGGIMSIIYSFINKIIAKYVAEYSYDGTYSGARIFIVVGLTAIVTLIIFRIFNAKRETKTVNFEVELNGQKFSLSGMCDSGNLLTEPFSGRRVILVCEACSLGRCITSIEDIYKKYIPYKDVTNSGMLRGVVPSKILIDGCAKDAVIAAVKTENFNGYEALVPSALL